MNDAMHTTLRMLRLSGLAQTLEVRLQEAAGNGLNHLEFLELVLQDELSVRADRRRERRIQAASFRDAKTLEESDFRFNISIKRKQIFEPATCKFIDQARDALVRRERARAIRFKPLAIRRSRRVTLCYTGRFSIWCAISRATRPWAVRRRF
ncbi:MAG: hypothetical protein IIB57_09895 [Planctomycetes bacterium]|nr:hypothetical protein [Planctomycetota bacterium]